MGVIAKITEVIVPESAVTGESIMIGAVSHNEGDTGDVYVRFVDRDTGEMIPIVVSHNVEYCTNAGGAGQIGMPAKSWNLRCEVGEGYPTDPISITDSRDLTILNPEAPPPTLVELLLPAISSAIAGTLAVMWGLSPG